MTSTRYVRFFPLIASRKLWRCFFLIGAKTGGLISRGNRARAGHRSGYQSTMYRTRLKFGAFIAIMFALMFTTWHVYVPKYVRSSMEEEDMEHDRAEFVSQLRTLKIGGESVRNRILTNGSRRHLHHNGEDSVFPFDANDYSIDVSYQEEGGFLSNNNNNNSNSSSTSKSRIKTFFSSLEKTFNDIDIGPNNEIPTLQFLEACDSLSDLFVRMNRMVLTKVGQDISGNVEKIRKCYDIWPNDSATVQVMLLRDVDKELDDEESTILPVTWLKRTFEFISRFLLYSEQEKEQSVAARHAYDETLRKHHGFFARGAFAAAIMTLSSRSAFLHNLAIDEADVDRPDFEATALEDLHEYNKGLPIILKILSDFFTENGITN